MRMTSLAVAVVRSLRGLGTPRPGETIVAALSGGADSVALLDALLETGRRWGFRVVAAHLDHGLRSASASDAEFCRNLCARLGVPLHVGAADVRGRARRDGAGLEAAARLERHAFLRRIAEAEAAAAIAVAHTRDDQAETFLLRLLRGAGSAGLGAMRPRAGTLIRPLLDVGRRDVLEHLQARGLEWREDETNADLRFARNRVRHELLPYLERHFNPSIRESLARTAALLSDEHEGVAQRARELYGRAARRGSGGVVLDGTALSQAPRPLARQVVRTALLEAGGLERVGAAHVEKILEVSGRSGRSGRRLPLPGGREAVFRFGQVRIGARPDRAEART
ncbi:MAG TPA: tRNA lysidine(34) synthetase TilS [Vicinamibacteria bacterium]|nr:tRNA lysidine(34) synthetase TilS [Vicinamibacteria bacterium]